MPSQINQAQQAPESALDKLLKVISIANQGVGAAAGIQDFRLKGAQASQAENLNRNRFTTADLGSKGLKKADPSLVSGPLLTPELTGPLSPEYLQSAEYKATPEYAAAKDIAGPLVNLTPLHGETQNTKGDWEDTLLTSDIEEKGKKESLKTLQDRYNANKTTERSAAMVEALAGIQALKAHPGELGPADIANKVKFIQVIDPSGGALRGGKLDTVEGSAGGLEAAQNLVNKWLTGKMSDTERKEFFNAANNLVGAQLEQQRKIDNQFTDDAKKEGVRYHSVLNPLFADMDARINYERSKQQEGAPKASAGPKVGDVLKGYRFKGGSPGDQNNWEKAN